MDPCAQITQTPRGKYPHKFVWVKHPTLEGALEPKVRGPYEVVDSDGPVIYIKLEGKPHAVSIDRCKPAFCIRDEALHDPLPEPLVVSEENFVPQPIEHEQEPVEADILPAPPGVPAREYMTRSKTRQNQQSDQQNSDHLDPFQLVLDPQTEIPSELSPRVVRDRLPK